MIILRKSILLDFGVSQEFFPDLMGISWFQVYKNLAQSPIFPNTRLGGLAMEVESGWDASK